MHVVFACDPVHSGPPEGPAAPDRLRAAPPPAALHRRVARCRRIAVGVSVVDCPAFPAGGPSDPAGRR